MRSKTYCHAINEALHQEMARDPSIFLYGLDVGDHKQTFGSTVGIEAAFGPQRIFSTPLSEDALMGFGLGAAMQGLRPVNIHIRVEFLLLAMNQLANMVTTYQYGTGGKVKVPLVIRAIIGRGWGQGFQHSKSLQSVFAHIPGLVVAMPTLPEDAKGLLTSALRASSPVLLLEHRWLYWMEGNVPEKSRPIPFGKARVLRKGGDATVVATSWMNIEARQAGEILKKAHGIEIEIIDPRTITPLDDEGIVRSVKKTKHCVVADYDWTFCGFGAEIAARVSEKCFSYLKSPVERIGFAPTLCPTTRPLEDKFYPNAFDIVRAVERALRLKKTDLSREVLYSHEHKFKGPF